jgi:2,5-diketo-D-gluconate reductase A
VARHAADQRRRSRPRDRGSNFPIDRLVDLAVQNEVTPAVNQVETHPFRQQHEAQQQLAELGVQIESWGPFAEGKNGLFANATLLKIAEEHGRTVAQVVLRWLTQRGVVAIPKSVRPERMAENLASQDFDLTDTDMAEIAALDTGETQFFDHHDPQWVRSLGTRRIS